MGVKESAPSYWECFASLALGMAPFFLLTAVSAMFGANTVTAGGENVYGLGALLVSAVLSLVFPAIFAGIQKLGYLIWRLLRPKREWEA